LIFIFYSFIVLSIKSFSNIFRKEEEEMNKGDLVNEVTKVVSTKKEAQAAVDCVIDSITKALKRKQTVTLVGFGTFKVDRRKARKGRNPQTGEEIKIKAKKVPKFVAGKALKDAVN
jgi:nucleoid DNA-binding protein